LALGAARLAADGRLAADAGATFLGDAAATAAATPAAAARGDRSDLKAGAGAGFFLGAAFLAGGAFLAAAGDRAGDLAAGLFLGAGLFLAAGDWREGMHEASWVGGGAVEAAGRPPRVGVLRPAQAGRRCEPQSRRRHHHATRRRKFSALGGERAGNDRASGRARGRAWGSRDAERRGGRQRAVRAPAAALPVTARAR